ncbi:unnamed protein product [Caenorhabditis bovis]|uniref:Uncharacterized protein n=1 Tax=Caenorhabditis bovis TaxID=2654633 RepID=A0A8S1F262_9PELO|nr:unnamed protein product [Caenorhabditis bovis]
MVGKTTSNFSTSPFEDCFSSSSAKSESRQSGSQNSMGRHGDQSFANRQSVRLSSWASVVEQILIRKLTSDDGEVRELAAKAFVNYYDQLNPTFAHGKLQIQNVGAPAIRGLSADDLLRKLSII